MGSHSWKCVIVFLGCLAAASALPATYQCPPTCLPPACLCASNVAPLPVEQMPQFLLFTHDDTTGPTSVGLINQTIAGLTNANGCTIPATLFTMHGQTQCKDVKDAYSSGHEIATHTWSHMPMQQGYKGGLGSIDKELVAVRDWLVANCSIPKADVIGFRSPYLVHNPVYRTTLKANGFLYDSTINEHWPMPETSPNGANRLWPYSMDAGIPQDCAWIAGNVCTPTEKHAGLWEVPVWVLQTDTYPEPAYTMDPCTGETGVCDTFSLLQGFFNLSYAGNKAPVPILIHSPWLSEPNNMAGVRNFMEWVTTNFKDAFFVTNHQLIQWMQNPVPKDKVGEWLGCVPGGVAAGALGVTPAASPPTAAVVSPPPTTTQVESPQPTVASPPPPQGAAAVVAPPPPSSSARTLGAASAALVAVLAALL